MVVSLCSLTESLRIQLGISLPLLPGKMSKCIVRNTEAAESPETRKIKRTAS